MTYGICNNYFPKLFLSFLLSSLMLTGCGTLFNYKTDSSDLEAIRYAAKRNLQFEVDSLAKPLVETGKMPGLAVGVLLPDGESKVYSYGVADTISQARINADTVFCIGSLSKVFLGLMAAKLADDGLLSWDATLAEALPQAVLSADAKAVTLGQLATHTSGLPRQPYDLRTLSYFIEYLFTGNNFYRHLDAEYIFAYLAKLETAKKEEPVYSNIGYGLLGYIVERITGKPLESLLAEIISQPLNLQHTGYGLGRSAAIAGRATGYAGDQPKFIARGQPVPDWRLTEFMKGSGAMYSSANDLLLLAKAYLTEPPHLKTALNDTLRVQLPGQNKFYPVGWIADNIDGQEIYYISGVIAGYTSFIGLDKTHNQAVVALQNSFDWSSGIGYQLLARLVKAQLYSAAGRR